MESAYGRWISFLQSRDDLDPRLSPGARVTEARLRAYIDELQTQIASTTLANRIRDLDSMIGYLDPNAVKAHKRQLADLQAALNEDEIARQEATNV